MAVSELDQHMMARALELARRGEGLVEPNPMVGCVLCRDDQILTEGWHAKFGGPHAEAAALAAAAQSNVDVRGATAYVTLEPCNHQGKTPPCSDALVEAGVARVVLAVVDPFVQVAGAGIAKLEAAGIEVTTGVLESESRQLLAPYLKLVEQQRPWLIAKWAMTLDGKLATRSGDSKWISSKDSRAIVHHIRGRVDAIVVGGVTFQCDDPQLTARPAGPRTATRVVLLGERQQLSPECQLLQTLDQAPVLIVLTDDDPRVQAIESLGCEVVVQPRIDRRARLQQLFDEFGSRKWTNVLLEGGGGVLGAAFDAQLVDEVHAFIAPRIVGGAQAVPAVGGEGLERMAEALTLQQPKIRTIGSDVYIHGRTRHS